MSPFTPQNGGGAGTLVDVSLTPISRGGFTHQVTLNPASSPTPDRVERKLSTIAGVRHIIRDGDGTYLVNAPGSRTETLTHAVRAAIHEELLGGKWSAHAVRVARSTPPGEAAEILHDLHAQKGRLSCFGIPAPVDLVREIDLFTIVVTVHEWMSNQEVAHAEA